MARRRRATPVSSWNAPPSSPVRRPGMPSKFKNMGAPAGARRVAEFREITTKVVNLLAERKINVTQRGVQAYVEHNADHSIRVLNLPYIPDDATEGLLSAIRGFLDHEVAHVLFTDRTEVNATLNKLSGADRDMTHNLWNILEDTMIERKMRKRFPGSGANLSYLRRFCFDQVQKAVLDQAKIDGDQGKILSSTMVPLLFGWAGDDESARICKEIDVETLLADTIKVLQPFKTRMPTLDNSGQVIALAQEMLVALRAASEPPPPPPPPPPSGGDGEDKPEENQDQEQSSGGESGDSSESESQPKEQNGDEKPSPDKSKPKPKKKEKEAPSEKPEPTEDGAAEDQDQGDGAAGEDTSEEKDPGERGDATPEGTGDEDEPESGDEDGEGSEGESDDEGGEEGEDAGGSGAGSGTDGDDSEGADEEGGDPGSTGTGDISSDSGGEPASNDLTDQDTPTPSGEDGDKEEEGESDEDAARRDIAIAILKAVEGSADDTGAAANVISAIARDSISDQTYLPFTTDHDTVGPVLVSGRHVVAIDAAISALENQTRHMVGAMQNQVRRLFAQQEQIGLQSGMRAGRLDANNLYRISVGDDRVFSRREEIHATDTAVTLLIDCSGSMSGDKITLACDAAYALSQTLDRIKINHEILGFTTGEDTCYAQAAAQQSKIGRPFSRTTSIVTYEFKTFAERTTIINKRRLVQASQRVRGARVDMSANVDGECVLIAAARLQKQPEPRKVLIVLSDGLPSAGEDDHLRAHLKFAVQECERRKIETVGIGIDSHYVKQFYPKSVVITDVKQLPLTVMEQLKKFLIQKRAA
jgi:cobalamin biosynthesis protein CobT